jgi:phage shock protein C
MPERIRRLYRSNKNRILGGVCSGLGDYLGIDPVIVRLVWALFALMGGSGILAYLIAWIIIPENPNKSK